MKKNLVIVESPAKAKTIEKFLGSDYVVKSSYGHIRDLKKKSFSIDENSFEPEYEIPEDKERVVAELKKLAKEAQTVWLASDEDREGEAISWHLKEVLGLSDETKRIVFHEITKAAILEAIQHPRTIDMSLVAAQQARRVLDRIVGFKLSPILWRKVKPALSAGRVQSVAVRLIVEKEREVQAFQSETYWRVVATLLDKESSDVQAELAARIKSEEEANALLQKLKGATFTVSDVQKKPMKRVPAPPFTTSTLQQEAAHKLGMTVSQTMSVAQRLYENGLITYMRTDSVNLSALCLGASKKYITEEMGAEYSKTRQYHTSSKGAQEAHEAIRPTYMDRTEIDGSVPEKRLYDLIWKRTIASQMADAEVERSTVTLTAANETFTAQGEVVKFDGFMKVYRATVEDPSEAETERTLPPLRKGETLTRVNITATEKFTTGPVRYNEASLVKKLEELGIGRPSTYATTITTIQQREYVQRGDKKGCEQRYTILTLRGEKISHSEKKIIVGAEKNKLIPTDIGVVVNDYLMENFPQIMDYNFTAEVEKDFDAVAAGKKKWDGLIRSFYKTFNPLVEETMNTHTEHKVGEKVLGTDPATGEPVMVKIGRFGPVAQIGSAESDKKPRFAQLGKGQSMETITLEEALELFRLPRNLGEYDGETVSLGSGRYGPYVQYGKQYVSVPKGTDPLTMTYEEAVALIQEKKKSDEKRHIKQFEEEPEMEIMNGRFGPYISYKGKNYRLTKAMAARAEELTLEECKKVVNA
ncbi:MAG: type I DNA topoisomerase [Bacteroidaceae bacterium]|nr:type I DNA topoisomerase [Bacteroidaceae bacterium]